MENLSVISRNPSVIYIGAENIDEDRIDGEFYNYKYLENEVKLKKSGIKIKVLNDVIERMNSPIGWQGIPSSSYLPHGLGVPLIRVQNVSDLILDEESLIGVEESIYDEQPAIQAQANDIIITRVGTIGRVCRIPEKINRIAMGQNLTRIKLNETLVESGFMLAYMSSKFCQIQMERYAYGGVQASLTNKNIKQLLVPIPSPEIQKYIGEKVRKAEELREEAKKLKKEAEGIIYKELNFGSLEDKLKIINNKYTWVGLHNLGIRIDSKYYNEKVLRIKDYFNKHYETIKLKECLQYCSRGKSFAESSEDGIILIKTKNLNNSFINYERNFVYEKEVNNNLNLKEKDLIFASMGVGSLGKIDMYYPSEEKATIDGTLMLLRFKSDSKLKPEYVMEFLRTHIGQKLIYQNVVGSTGIISISVDNLINIDIPYIDDEKQEKISNFTNKYLTDIYASKRLIQEAKQDVEDLIEGNFDMSKIKAHS